MSLFSSQQDLVKSWSFFTLSTLEEVASCGSWGFLVLNDGIDLPDGEINPLGKLILIINFEPLIKVLNCMWLYILAYLQILQLFLLQNNVILSGLGWLSELSPVRCLLGIFPESFFSRFHIESANYGDFRLCVS